MRDDDSNALPALGTQVDIPSPDRLQSLLRAAQARALEHTPLPEPTADENLHWDAPPPELVESLAGFKIIDTIDQGGQGIVYKARHEQTGQFIAVKVLRNGRLSSRSERSRFEREIQTLAKLKHPNIVKFIPHHNTSPFKYFCMEFIEGEPVDVFVFQRRLSVRDVVQMTVKICDAVQSAHQAMVLHRDLKPANVLVTSDGEPHVLDFGLSRDLDAEMRGLQSRVSNTDQRVGTLVYSSPEQVDERAGEVDTRTDVYALGIMLYELLAGCKPYPVHGSTREVIDSITTATPRSLRRIVATTKADDRWTSGSISDDLEKVILKALEKEQSRRYQSVEALKDDLQRYLRGDPVTAKSASYGYVLRKLISRHRWGFALTAALLFVVFGSAVTMLAMWQRNLSLAKSAQDATMMNTLIKSGQSAQWANGPADAVPAYQSALELAKSLDPSDPKVQITIFEASLALARICVQQGDIVRALPYLNTAEQIAESEFRARPDDIGALRQKALVCSCQSDRWLKRAASMKSIRQPEYLEAQLLYLKYAEDAVAFRRRIVALSSEDDRQKLDFVASLSFLGGKLMLDNQPKKSLACLSEAIDIQTILLTKEPKNVEYCLTFAEVESAIAGAHLKYRKPAHDLIALEWIERSEKRLEDLQASRNALYRGSDIINLRNGNDINRKMALKREATRQAIKDAADDANSAILPGTPIY